MRRASGGSTSGRTWPSAVSGCAMGWNRRVGGPWTLSSAPRAGAGLRWMSSPRRCRPVRSCRAAGWGRVATYNTPIQTNSSYPIIGLSGLLHLIAVVEKFRPQAEPEKGSLCQPTSSPPAPRARRAHPGVDAAARRESPTPPVAAQPAARASAARRRSPGGGQR
jgi:hypothetical protein